MTAILAANSAFPQHYYRQDELERGLLAMCGKHGHRWNEDRVRKLFASVKVEGRHLALPLPRYSELSGLGDRNREWLRVSLELGESAVKQALDAAGLAPEDIGLFISSTVTGIAVPSLEARIMNRLGFSSDCRRMPLFGLGCLAGAAGIARAHDYLLGHPSHAAILLCCELCSLTFQLDDASVANIISCGLFADGAACVVMVGRDHPLAARGKLRVQDSRSVFFPNTERVMGWDVVDTGFRVVLSGQVPELARTALCAGIRAFLHSHGHRPTDVVRWVAHPGGPAVIDAMEQGLELQAGTLSASRECLARIGNLSSASVLVILEQALREGSAPGLGLLLAMGPAFCAELLLLQC